MIKDIEKMHEKFGVNEWVGAQISNKDLSKVKQLLDFRIKVMLNEEFNETVDALFNEDAEELVDGLIDIVVIAIGTLDILQVNVNNAWSQVMDANLSKESGIKPSRPNPLGLPDLIKPQAWTPPDHSNNHGILEQLWVKQE